MSDLVGDLFREAIDRANAEDIRETAPIPKDVLAPDTEKSLIQRLLESPENDGWRGYR